MSKSLKKVKESIKKVAKKVTKDREKGITEISALLDADKDVLKDLESEKIM